MNNSVRSGKAPTERYVTKAMRWPPELWAEIEELVPERERAAFIRHAVKEALLRRAAERLVGFYASDPETADWADFVGDDPGD